jgi:glycosyltransferase involved in cell wall biosynthesis
MMDSATGSQPAGTHNNPLVSICIPTYNRADMVSGAITSALNQTYKHLEVIVVDNASTDRIEEVVASFKDPRIKFYKNQKNLGLFGNFNKCIELSHGKYVHILHSDDWIDPEFTKTCTYFLESHPHVAMTFTSLVMHTAQKSESFHVSDKNEIFLPPEGFRQLLLRRGFIGCPSVMVRREVYDTIGLFSLEYPYSADYYQWMKITRKFSVSYIHDVYLHYCQGEHSESYRLLFKSPVGYIDTLKIFIQLIQDLSDTYSDYSSEINIALRRFSRDCLYAGFTRAESMHNVKPVLFYGISQTSLELIRPNTLHEHARLFFDTGFTWMCGIFLRFSVTHSMIGRILRRNIIDY